MLSPPQDFLAMLMDQVPDASQEELGHYMCGLIFASFSTTRDALAQSLICLSTRPEMVARLREEVREHADASGNLTSESAKNLKWAEACVKESVRIAVGPIGNAFRKVLAPEGFELSDGVVLPYGTVACLNGMTHYNEIAFRNAAEYDPERFMDGSVRAAHFAGFGSGVHMCPYASRCVM